MKVIATAIFVVAFGHAHAQTPASGLDVPKIAESLFGLAHDDPNAAMWVGRHLLNDAIDEPATRLHVLTAMGRAAQWLSRDRVIEVAQALEQEHSETASALAQVFRAQTLVESGHPDGGLAMLREAMHHLSAAGPYWAAMADMEICDAMVTATSANVWREPCERARSAWRSAQRTLELARTENLLSLGYWNDGEIAVAIRWAQSARAQFQAGGSRGGVAMMNANLAELRLLMGQPQQALEDAGKALEFELGAGKHIHALSTQNVRAAALTALGRPEEAIALLDPSIAEAKSLDAARILEDLLSTRLEASSRSRSRQEVAADSKALVAAIRTRYSKLVEAESANLENVYQLDLKSRQVRRLEMERRIQLLEAEAARADLEVATLRGDRWKLAGLLVSVVVGFVLLQFVRIRRKHIELQAENRRRVELVGQAFHEVRNPLVSISGLLDFALESLRNHPSRSLIASARAAAAAVAESAQHQLDSVQVARDAVTLHLEVFEPSELIRQVCELISPEAWRKRLLLVQHIADRVPTRLLGDENRIRQVLWNIASNAVKFTSRGSIRFDLDYSDGRLLISVTDTGPGICAADLERVFEPFQRAPANQSRTYGVGLGLSVADKLVRCMNGRIVPTAPVEGGMRFDIEVPLQPVESLDAHSVASDTARRAATVLIVEDDPFMSELLALQIEQIGAHPLHVQSADDALRTMMSARPPLVLVDYHLGEEKGTDLVARLRAACSASPSRIVMVSASQPVRPESLDAAHEPDAWIRKPVSREALIAQLQLATLATASGEDDRGLQRKPTRRRDALG